MPSLELLYKHLWTPPVGWEAWTVYAVLDGARNKRIAPAVRKSDLQYWCLYEGELPRELLGRAPYLVQLERGTAFTDMILTEGWADSWGIFAAAPVGLESVRRHFRRFLRVVGPNGKQMYFRYYDPRVLRLFLPTCNSQELQFMFGPLETYFSEAEKGQGLLKYTRKFDKLSPSVSKLVTVTLDVEKPPAPEVEPEVSFTPVTVEDVLGPSEQSVIPEPVGPGSER